MDESKIYFNSQIYEEPIPDDNEGQNGNYNDQNQYQWN